MIVPDLIWPLALSVKTGPVKAVLPETAVSAETVPPVAAVKVAVATAEACEEKISNKPAANARLEVKNKNFFIIYVQLIVYFALSLWSFPQQEL